MGETRGDEDEKLPVSLVQTKFLIEVESRFTACVCEDKLESYSKYTQKTEKNSNTEKHNHNFKIIFCFVCYVYECNHIVLLQDCGYANAFVNQVSSSKMWIAPSPPPLTLLMGPVNYSWLVVKQLISTIIAVQYVIPNPVLKYFSSLHVDQSLMQKPVSSSTLVPRVGPTSKLWPLQPWSTYLKAAAQQTCYQTTHRRICIN